MFRPSIALTCLLAGCAVSLLGGCPASHARIDESPHAFVEAWFDAQCELALRCEYVAFRGSRPIDICHPSSRERWRRMADAVLAGDADFDGDRALACVAALTSSACAVPLDATLPHEICSDVIVGAAPVGATCEAAGSPDVRRGARVRSHRLSAVRARWCGGGVVRRNDARLRRRTGVPRHPHLFVQLGAALRADARCR